MGGVVPHGRIREIHLHHSPAAEPRAERKLEQQLAQGVLEKQPTGLLIRVEETRFDQARESVFDGLAANRSRPHERRGDQRGAADGDPSALQDAALPQTDGGKHEHADGGHDRQGAHLGEIEGGHANGDGPNAEDPDEPVMALVADIRDAEHHGREPGHRRTSREVAQPWRANDRTPVRSDIRQRIDDRRVETSRQRAELWRQKQIGIVDLQDTNARR